MRHELERLHRLQESVGILKGQLEDALAADDLNKIKLNLRLMNSSVQELEKILGVTPLDISIERWSERQRLWDRPWEVVAPEKSEPPGELSGNC